MNRAIPLAEGKTVTAPREICARMEAIAALVLAWVLVFVVPFRWTKRLFGTVSPPRPDQITNADLAQARAVAVTRRLQRIANEMPWKSTCLVRALAGHLLLERRGLRGAVVRLGVSMENGRVSAHAWLVFGPDVLLGGESMDGFTPLADLAA